MFFQLFRTKTKWGISALDRPPPKGSVALPTSLPGGVMVAQATLTRLVMVRIHAGQPFDAHPKTVLAHGLRPASQLELRLYTSPERRMASSKRSASRRLIAHGRPSPRKTAIQHCPTPLIQRRTERSDISHVVSEVDHGWGLRQPAITPEEERLVSDHKIPSVQRAS